jgi:hypothetical protein
MFSSVTEELSFPYFNAGAVYTKDAATLGREWMACCLEVDHDSQIGNKSFHLDQIALPIAIGRLGWRFRTLSERWNFPARLRLLGPNGSARPFLAHYHDIPTILRSGPLMAHIRRLLAAYEELHTFVLEHDLGPRLLEAMQRQTAVANEPCTTILLTGLPDTGTQQVASTLARQSNIVIAEDPAEVLRGLTARDFRRSLITHHAEMRRRLAKCQPKAPAAKRAIVGASRSEAPPRSSVDGGEPVDGGSMIIGTSSTLPYLTRLDSLRGRADFMRTIVCIRSPAGSIRVWKNSPSCLATGDVRTLVSRGDIEACGGADVRRLDEISRASDVRVRRALLWRYLARIVADNQEWLTIVKYEHLAMRPSRVWPRLAELLGSAPIAKGEFAETADDRAPGEELDSDELDIVADICVQEADVFGYA